MPRLRVLVALALVASGLGALAWSAGTADAVDRPVRASSAHLVAALPRASAAAYGRRVLLIRTPPLEPARGEVFESARAPGGWELYDGAPADAASFAAALERLSATAAADWEDDRRLSQKTIRRLAESGVAVVFVEDGRRIVSPEAAANEAGVSPETSVPGLRVRAAEPVMRVVDGPDGVPELRVVTGTSNFEDGLWGGSIVVEVDQPGRHVFAWPAEGARVTVDGVPAEAQTYSAELPLVALDLAAGNVAVEVTYADSSERAAVASGGALALTLGLLALLIAFRAHPDTDDAPEAARPEDATSATGGVE